MDDKTNGAKLERMSDVQWIRQHRGGEGAHIALALHFFCYFSLQRAKGGVSTDVGVAAMKKVQKMAGAGGGGTLAG